MLSSRRRMVRSPPLTAGVRPARHREAAPRATGPEALLGCVARALGDLRFHRRRGGRRLGRLGSQSLSCDPRIACSRRGWRRDNWLCVSYSVGYSMRSAIRARLECSRPARSRIWAAASSLSRGRWLGIRRHHRTFSNARGRRPTMDGLVPARPCGPAVGTTWCPTFLRPERYPAA